MLCLWRAGVPWEFVSPWLEAIGEAATGVSEEGDAAKKVALLELIDVPTLSPNAAIATIQRTRAALTGSGEDISDAACAEVLERELLRIGRQVRQSSSDLPPAALPAALAIADHLQRLHSRGDVGMGAFLEELLTALDVHFDQDRTAILVEQFRTMSIE